MIKKFAIKYYWVVLLVITVGGSWWLSFRAWDLLHTPRLLDINPLVYAPPLPEFWNILLLLPTIGIMWWYSPIYFQVSYTLSFIWCIFLFWAYRPCIDISSVRVASSKEETK